MKGFKKDGRENGIEKTDMLLGKKTGQRDEERWRSPVKGGTQGGSGT